MVYFVGTFRTLFDQVIGRIFPVGHRQRGSGGPGGQRRRLRHGPRIEHPPPLPHEDKVLKQGEDLWRRLMNGDDDGDAGIGQGAQLTDDQLGVVRREAGGWLVQTQQFRTRQQFMREARLFPLAATQTTYKPVRRPYPLVQKVFDRQSMSFRGNSPLPDPRCHAGVTQAEPVV